MPRWESRAGKRGREVKSGEKARCGVESLGRSEGEGQVRSNRGGEPEVGGMQI